MTYTGILKPFLVFLALLLTALAGLSLVGLSKLLSRGGRRPPGSR